MDIKKISWLIVNSIFVLEILVVLQGAILVIVLNKRKNQNSILLSLIILCIILNLIFDIIMGYGLVQNPVPIGYFFALCYGPLLYIYIKTYFNIYRFSWIKLILHLTLAISILLITFFDYKILYIYEKSISLVVSAQIALYLILSYKSFVVGKRRITISTNFKIKSITWVKKELNLFIFIFFTMVTIGLLKVIIPKYLVIDIMILFLFISILYLMILIMLKTLFFPKPINLINKVSSQRLDEISRYITKNELFKDSSLKINQVASHANISTKELSVLIREHYGASFNHFINEMRIIEVKKRLTDSNDPVKNIMYDTGFNSRSVLNETFKKFIGMSPTEYRKSCKDF